MKQRIAQTLRIALTVLAVVVTLGLELLTARVIGWILEVLAFLAPFVAFILLFAAGGLAWHTFDPELKEEHL